MVDSFELENSGLSTYATVHEGELFVTTGLSVDRFSLQEPTEPSLLASIPMFYLYRGIRSSGELLYFGSSNPSAYPAFVAKPFPGAAIEILGVIQLSSGMSDFDVRNGFMVSSLNQGQMVLVDCRDPENTVVVGAFDHGVEFARSISISHHRVVISGQQTQVLDIADCLSAACLADINLSNAVDTDDLLAMIAAWGPCESTDCRSDLNWDGIVNTDDLLELLAAWGPCGN